MELRKKCTSYITERSKQLNTISYLIILVSKFLINYQTLRVSFFPSPCLSYLYCHIKQPSSSFELVSNASLCHIIMRILPLCKVVQQPSNVNLPSPLGMQAVAHIQTVYPCTRHYTMKLRCSTTMNFESV